MVEVFRTNVSTQKNAGLLLGVLQSLFPESRFNFDLEDRDRILRVETGPLPIPVEKILRTVRDHDFQIEVLPDL